MGHPTNYAHIKKLFFGNLVYIIENYIKIENYIARVPKFVSADRPRPAKAQTIFPDPLFLAVIEAIFVGLSLRAVRSSLVYSQRTKVLATRISLLSIGHSFSVTGTFMYSKNVPNL